MFGSPTLGISGSGGSGAKNLKSKFPCWQLADSRQRRSRCPLHAGVGPPLCFETLLLPSLIFVHITFSELNKGRVLKWDECKDYKKSAARHSNSNHQP